MRVAEIEDLPRIIELMQEVNLNKKLGLIESATIKLKILKYIEQRNVCVLVRENIIQGYYIIQDYTTLFGVYELGIVSVYITKKYKHLFKYVLNCINKEAIDYGVSRIRMSVDTGDNKRLEKLIKNFGYRTVGFNALYTL